MQLLDLLLPFLSDGWVLVAKPSVLDIALNELSSYLAVWVDGVFYDWLAFLPAVEWILESVNKCPRKHLSQNYSCTVLLILGDGESWLQEWNLPDFSTAIVREEFSVFSLSFGGIAVEERIEWVTVPMDIYDKSYGRTLVYGIVELL